MVMATADPMYFFANAGTGWKTLNNAIDALKAKPADFAWGACLRSSPMFTQVDLLTAAGISMDTIKTTKMVVLLRATPHRFRPYHWRRPA